MINNKEIKFDFFNEVSMIMCERKKENRDHCIHIVFVLLCCMERYKSKFIANLKGNLWKTFFSCFSVRDFPYYVKS